MGGRHRQWTVRELCEMCALFFTAGEVRRMSPIKESASWSLASQFLRAFPTWRVFHTHPGGGQYDCLLLVDRVDSPSIRIDINRHGSIHAQVMTPAGEEDGYSDSDWFETLMEGTSPRDLAQHVCRSVGIEWPATTPATTRWSLTYRVIAQVITDSSMSLHPLRATTWWFDTSGPEDSFLLMSTPHRELEPINPSEVWLLMDQDVARGWLWNGWVWTGTHERLDLYARYRAGASVALLATQILDLSHQSTSTNSPPPWVVS